MVEAGGRLGPAAKKFIDDVVAHVWWPSAKCRVARKAAASKRVRAIGFEIMQEQANVMATWVQELRRGAVCGFCSVRGDRQLFSISGAFGHIGIFGLLFRTLRVRTCTYTCACTCTFSCGAGDCDIAIYCTFEIFGLLLITIMVITCVLEHNEKNLKCAQYWWHH